jgi:hypothetical protein
MPLNIPPAPVPIEHRALTYEQVSQRWKTRLSIARLKLKNAGIPVVYVPRPPVEGVKLTDLLRYEGMVRRAQQKGK